MAPVPTATRTRGPSVPPRSGWGPLHPDPLRRERGSAPRKSGAAVLESQRKREKVLMLSCLESYGYWACLPPLRWDSGIRVGQGGPSSWRSIRPYPPVIGAILPGRVVSPRFTRVAAVEAESDATQRRSAQSRAGSSPAIASANTLTCRRDKRRADALPDGIVRTRSSS